MAVPHGSSRASPHSHPYLSDGSYANAQSLTGDLQFCAPLGIHDSERELLCGWHSNGPFYLFHCPP